MLKGLQWFSVLLLTFIASPSMLAASAPPFNRCAAIANPQQRLQCYDKMAAQARTTQKVQPPTTPMASVSVNPADQAMLSTLREAWGGQVLKVFTSAGILQVHTAFAKVNQIAYEVMLATMCGRLVKNDKLYAHVKSIAILNQAENQGFLFTAPSECDQIAFKPVNQTRLIILGNTRRFNA